VVAIPTETVYGLAASLSKGHAIERIFSLKGRPNDNPLIVHLADYSQVPDYAKEMPDGFDQLARCFWPGPLTVVLPAIKKQVPDIVRAGLSTVALRIPGHPITRRVLEQTGPLVMPSANLSGKPSATSPDHVAHDFGQGLPVLDGGESWKGVESTILLFRKRKWEIVRLGALTPEIFGPCLGYTPLFHQESERPVCPGQLYRHYAPQAVLTLDPCVPPEEIGAVLGFSNRKYPQTCKVFTLGPLNDPETVIKKLYKTLRLLDSEGVQAAWVDTDFPNTGLWATISERLRKASKNS